MTTGLLVYFRTERGGSEVTRAQREVEIQDAASRTSTSPYQGCEASEGCFLHLMPSSSNKNWERLSHLVF